MVVGRSRAPVREETQGAEISVKPEEGERMRNPSVQMTPIPLSPSSIPKRQQQERTGKIISGGLASGIISPAADGISELSLLNHTLQSSIRMEK